MQIVKRRITKPAVERQLRQDAKPFDKPAHRPFKALAGLSREVLPVRGFFKGKAMKKPVESNYPPVWPGTAIIKSTHNAFNWRGQASEIIAASPEMRASGKRGPKPSGTGTIHGLSPKADKRCATHGLPGHLVRPPSHGGAYSKAASAK